MRKKEIKKENPDYVFACRVIDCKEVLKKMPAVNASEKAKEKAELGTRIASRLSLVPVVGLEPTRCCHQRILSFTIYSVTDRI